VTAAVPVDAQAIRAVTQQLASSIPMPSVTPAMKTVALAAVSLLATEQFVGLVRECVILKRLARELAQLALLMPLLLMVSYCHSFLFLFYSSALYYFLVVNPAYHFLGTSCGNSSSLSCASGQCTSRDLQCKTLMGSYTQGNDTYACSSSGCQISCASPEFGSNVCYSMQQNFLDGTSCQGGGKCSNGQCKGSSVGKEIKSWIQHNKPLVIGLSAAVGGLIIMTIVSCCWSRYRRRQRLAARKNVTPPPGWRGPNQWQQMPQQQSRNDMRNVPHGGNEYVPGGGWENGRWNPNPQPPPLAWQPTVRYA
jgi:hypothetical protein